MANKNVQLKDVAGTNNLYPATTISQVDGLQSSLDAKQGSLTAGSGISISDNTIAAEITYEEQLDTPVVTSSTPGVLQVTEVAGASSYKVYAGSTEIGDFVFEDHNITVTTTHVTASASNPATIRDGATATLTFTAESGYNLPANVAVTGATGTWTQATGTMVLSNPTGAVSFSVVGESAIVYPTKGQLITMTLGNSTPAAGTQDQYRVLSINGSIAEVVAMYDQDTSTMFDDSNNTYNGSDLDTYLNSTFYSSLSSTAKAAIVDKTLTQYQYTYSSSAYDATTHASYADYSTKAVKESSLTRHVYALDVEDIETYFNSTFSTANIWTLFWNTTAAPSTVTYPWLRSANADYSDYAWYVYGLNGYVNSSRIDRGRAVRPALTIDLSKISWS